MAINVSGQPSVSAVSPAATTTSQTLSQLNNAKTAAYTNYYSVLGSGTQDQINAARATVNQTNQQYVAAYTASQNNGGVIPGSSSNDTGIGISDSSGLLGSSDSANALGTQNPDTPTNIGTASDLQSTSSLAPSTNTPIISSVSSLSSEGRINMSTTATLASTATTTTLPATTITTVSNPAANTTIVTVNDQRIRLTPKNSKILTTGSMLSPLIPTQGLMFPYTPIMQYIGNSNYGTQNLTHANQDVRFFTNLQSTTFTISGKFTAQTDEEAKYLLASLHFLRTVQKMRFGQGSALGLPPPILVLNGYGLAILNNLSVIITNFTMDMPDNVDYVQTSGNNINAWVPSYTTITVTCVVQNTPNKLRTFNWDTFASGSLLAQGGWS